METKVVKIESSGMDGEGIAKENGKVIFVPGAVEGDEASIVIAKENKSFCTAILKDVIKPSEFRCKPKCPYFGTCGGCGMQHIDYNKSLEIKAGNIQSLINKIKLDARVNNTISSDEIYSYRNKLTMYLTKSRSLGFYQKNSKQLVDINRCELVSEKFNLVIEKLNVFFQKNVEYNPLTVRGVAIREINNIYILNFILSKKINFLKLENYLKLNKINYSLHYCVNNKQNSNLPSYPVYFVGGVEKIILDEFGIKYPIYPMSFLQVNNGVKSKIYTHILSLVDGDSTVLDAYSGAGLLSACMAKKSKHVFAVEIDTSANRACVDLCELNKIKNLTAICGDVGAVVPTLVKENKVDIIVLDPARKGVDEETLNSIVSAKPKKVIYLSCNPATLVRDLAILCSRDYKIEFIQPYDMFPQTSEVETLVLLEHK